MEKFTQGEWKLHGMTIISKGKGQIAKILERWCSNKERQANAHLISAAPNQHRALKSVSDKLPFMPNTFGGGYSITLTQAEVDAIRAALAKADGEQQ